MDAPADAPRYLVWLQAQGPYHAQGLPWLVRPNIVRPTDTEPLAFATEEEARAVAERLNSAPSL